MSVYDGTQSVCDKCGAFNTYLLCDNCIRDLISRIVKRKFPIGERRWCKECAKRIASAIEEEMNA